MKISDAPKLKHMAVSTNVNTTDNHTKAQSWLTKITVYQHSDWKKQLQYKHSDSCITKCAHRHAFVFAHEHMHTCCMHRCTYTHTYTTHTHTHTHTHTQLMCVQYRKNVSQKHLIAETRSRTITSQIVCMWLFIVHVAQKVSIQKIILYFEKNWRWHQGRS